ncbi:hypothetical protein BU15DRAFT_73230 [Melanogaster broomeanus]|nr:hypothetical protein BU15DRAFT_73230 [Melanogaster broomeanus]
MSFCPSRPPRTRPSTQNEQNDRRYVPYGRRICPPPPNDLNLAVLHDLRDISLARQIDNQMGRYSPLQSAHQALMQTLRLETFIPILHRSDDQQAQLVGLLLTGIRCRQEDALLNLLHQLGFESVLTRAHHRHLESPTLVDSGTIGMHRAISPQVGPSLVDAPTEITLRDMTSIRHAIDRRGSQTSLASSPPQSASSSSSAGSSATNPIIFDLILPRILVLYIVINDENTSDGENITPVPILPRAAPRHPRAIPLVPLSHAGRTMTNTSGTPSSLSSPDTEETFGLTRAQIANALFETEERLMIHDHPVSQTPEERLARDFQGENQTGPVLRSTHAFYAASCFECHRLGHIQINCHLYECPICRNFRPGHNQRDCPQRRRPSNPPPAGVPSVFLQEGLLDYETDDPYPEEALANITGSPGPSHSEF